MSEKVYIKKGYHTIHGESRRHQSNRLYWVWWAMIQRTSNPKSKAFKDYGGRGIVICDEWLNPTSFFLWARSHGYAEGLQIDRIDNDGPYSPDNCKFSTRSENCINRRQAPNSGITYIPSRRIFQIYICRNGIRYYGGSSKDFTQAVELRDILLSRLTIL